MKRLAALVASGLWVPALLQGQISVEVAFEQEQYLPCEPLIAGVKIYNFSGRTLNLGQDQEWLAFAVESDDRRIVEKQGEPPVVEAFELPSSAKATRRVDLAPYFDLSRPGRYRITATVRIPQVQQEVSSKPQSVNIAGGAKLWEQEFGLPLPAGEDGAPEIRKYALVQAMNRKQVRLYARVTDRTETKVYRVFPIGPLLSFSRPEAQVDKVGRLHVLFQSGARVFTYSVIRGDGQVVVRESYQYTSRPVLKGDANGMFGVIGGVRITSEQDQPPGAQTNAPAALPAPTGAQPGTESPGASPQQE